MGTVLLVALGFVLGVLFLALIAWIAFNFLGFRIVQTNAGTPVPASPPVRPSMPPVVLSKGVPAAAPSGGASKPLSKLRVDLFIGEDRVPLIYTRDLPAELTTARLTMTDVAVRSYSRGDGLPVEPLPPFSVSDVATAGVIMVGRGGNVRPDIPGLDMMSRILFEIRAYDGAFQITARRGMQDAAMLQVKVGKDEPKPVKSQDFNLRVAGVTEIRQEVPNFKEPKPSIWYFKISLCD